MKKYKEYLVSLMPILIETNRFGFSGMSSWITRLLRRMNWNGTSILISFVYAKCKAEQREELWDTLKDITDKYKIPWYIARDFNCVVDPCEKKGGSPHRMSKSLPLIH